MHLPGISSRSAATVALLVLVAGWKPGSILNSTMQAQSSASVATANAEASSAKVDTAAARQSSSYGKLPMSFEVNRGQTDGAVQFLARGAGYTLFLTPGEAVLSLHSSQAGADRAESHGGPSARRPAGEIDAALPSSTVRLQLIGSNTRAKVEGVDALPGKSNYFFGNDPAKWHLDVPTYAKVRYSDVYPGIDLMYYGNQEGRLEHDFAVAAGADPNAIAIGLDDSEGAVPDKNGGLTLHTKTGDLTLRMPVAYQEINGERKIISASYLLADNQIKFAVGSYDKNAVLVIDPVIEHSAVFGGTAPDYPNAIAVDSAGNAYVTGYTSSTSFPVAHPFEATIGISASAAFVSKLNAAGTALVYSTFLSGYNDSTLGYGIAVDSGGRAYVVGATAGLDFPVKNAYQPTFGGRSDAFLTVLAAAGDSLVYSTFLGAAGNDGGSAIALDASGNAYIAGGSAASFPRLHSIGLAGTAFVAKFSSTGVLQYSSVFGAGALPLTLALDAGGNAYVAGFTNSSGISASKNAFQSKCLSVVPTRCGFVAKINPSGDTLVYSTFLGSSDPSSDSGVNNIAIDSSGSAYVAGWTGPGFPITTKAFQKTSGRGLVAKLNASGTGLTWSTYLGGPDDGITGLALDQYRQVYLTGYTKWPTFPVKAPLQTYHALADTHQGFVTTLSGSLDSIVYYSTYFGTTDGVTAIAVDKALNVYVAGVTGDVGINGRTDLTIQATPGALHTHVTGNPGGDRDVFVSKLVIMDDIALGVSATAGSVVHGGNLTYTIAVTSKGPDFGYNVRVANTLPAGTTFVSYGSGGGTCRAPAVGGMGTLNCTLPRLDQGATWNVTLTINVNAATGTKLSNTATSVSNMQDFVPGNNAGTLTTMVN